MERVLCYWNRKYQRLNLKFYTKICNLVCLCIQIMKITASTQREITVFPFNAGIVSQNCSLYSKIIKSNSVKFQEKMYSYIKNNALKFQTNTTNIQQYINIFSKYFVTILLLIQRMSSYKILSIYVHCSALLFDMMIANSLYQHMQVI